MAAEHMPDVRAVRTPSLLDAIAPLVILAVLIAGSLQLFGLHALDGPIQVALMLCCAAAALIGLARLDQIFWINPLNLLPLVLLVILSIRRAPASLALLAAALFAGIQATILQRDAVDGVVTEIGGSANPLTGSVQAVWKVITGS